MPHIVELDLTPTDFRQFYCAEDEPAAAKAPAHWLLSAVYGRDLLKAKLRKERPDLNVPNWRHGADLDPHLECMVDSLGLRDWVQPATVAARVRYLKFVLSLMVAVENGKPIPSNKIDAKSPYGEAKGGPVVEQRSAAAPESQAV